MSSSHYSDEELLEMIRESDSNYGYSLLTKKYSEPLYWFIRKIVLNHEDANDVLQDSYLKAFQKIDQFEGRSSLKTWLYQIAYRTSLDALKKKRNRFFLPLSSMSDVLLNQLKADSYFDADEAELKFQQALAKLPHRQREVFLLVYYEEMPLKEIATILKITEGAVKANSHLAKQKLKKFLSPD